MKQPFSGPTLETIPAHIPPELVYAYDIARDARMLEEPHARMRSLQHEAPPIFFTPCNGGHWVVTGKKAVQDITMNPGLYSNRLTPEGVERKRMELLPISEDPPRHTVYRTPLNVPLAARTIAGMEPAIRAMSQELIERVLGAGRCDFLADIAEPLPVTLFLKLAGMPTDRLLEFRHLATTVISVTTEPAARDAASAQIAAMLAQTIQTRQAKREDDLISRLLDASIEGRSPTFDEILRYSMLLFFGGLDTVVNALSFSVRFLARDQELQAKLRADPSLLPAAIEELLRLHGVASVPRRVTRDDVFQGVQFKQDEPVLLLLPSANYDEAAYPQPEQFILGRPEQHMTFNTGPHRCVGLNLARLELKVFFEEWFQRVPPFRLDPEAPPKFAGGFTLNITHLPLLWS